jgi:hypothetical protein
MKKLLILFIFPFCLDAHGSITQTKICKTDSIAYKKAIASYPVVNLLQRLPSLKKFTICKDIKKPVVKKTISKKSVKTKGKL